MTLKWNEGSSRNAQQGLHFLNLPPELQDLVFGFLDLHDCVHLGLSHSSFWPAVRRSIQAHHMSLVGEWAGQRIICMGEDSVADDPLPAGLFNETEEIELSKHVFKRSTGPIVPFNLELFARTKYRNGGNANLFHESHGMFLPVWNPPFTGGCISDCVHCIASKFPVAIVQHYFTSYIPDLRTFYPND